METIMEKAERRGKPYIDAVKHCMEWEEYTKTHPVPKEGDIIRVKDPDTKKVYEAKVTRIAKNGIRASIVGMSREDGLISVNKIKNDVWE